MTALINKVVTVVEIDDGVVFSDLLVGVGLAPFLMMSER